MSKRVALLVWAVIAGIGALTLVHSIRRDIRYEDEYPGDLRNRVVGARLVLDGRDPYLYKWKSTDGLRYYDPENFWDLPVSMTTASPFVLHLYAPIANWPEGQIIPLWLVLQYLALAGVTVICLLVAGTTVQKQLVVALAVVLTLTNGWKEHMNLGQYYIFIPLLMAVFYRAMRRKAAPAAGALAGLLAASLVLYRLNTLCFLLPFVLLVRRYPRNWLLAFCIAPLLLGGWILGSPRERGLWLNYSVMLDQQMRMHQGLPYRHQAFEPDPHYILWEGQDKEYEDEMWHREPDKFYPEYGNVCTLVWIFFKRRLPIAAWTILTGVVVIGLFVVFYQFNRARATLTLEQVVLFGFCLYMSSEFLSPALRHQYNMVEWIFPLLLMAAIVPAGRRAVLWLLLPPLLLTIVHVPFLKLRHTLGEYLFIGILLTFTLFYVRKGYLLPKEAVP